MSSARKQCANNAFTATPQDARARGRKRGYTENRRPSRALRARCTKKIATHRAPHTNPSRPERRVITASPTSRSPISAVGRSSSPSATPARTPKTRFLAVGAAAGARPPRERRGALSRPKRFNRHARPARRTVPPRSLEISSRRHRGATDGASADRRRETGARRARPTTAAERRARLGQDRGTAAAADADSPRELAAPPRQRTRIVRGLRCRGAAARTVRIPRTPQGSRRRGGGGRG